MWEETSVYQQIINAVSKYEEKNKAAHIKTIFVRSNGETQEKEGYFYHPAEWITEVLDAYWLADEAEIKVFVGEKSFYWKHPTLVAPVTIEEIEKQDKVVEEQFRKSSKKINDHVIMFGA